MQHCATSSVLNDLRVVRAVDVPYKFEIVPGADFTHSEGYGAIKLRHFCCFGTILEGVRFRFTPDHLKYCAKMYYTSISHLQFNFEIFIIRNLNTKEKVCDVIVVCISNGISFLQAIEKKYRKSNTEFERGPSSKVQFEKDEIHFIVPKTCDGWSMKALNSPLVSREDVDDHTFRNVLVPCQVRVRWDGDGNNPRALLHEIHLSGAKKPRDFLTVTSPKHCIDPDDSKCTLQTATTKSTCLGIGDLNEVLTMLQPVSERWKELGLALGLKDPTINQIYAEDRGNISECKRKMLSSWLQWTDDCKATCNWRSLAEALKSRTVNHKPIAEAIQNKYL
jgi:hypothetical protein